MIFSQRFGAPGGVPTVLAHCFLGHSGAWRPLVEGITPPLDALAFDMPGHGRSPMPDPSVDLLAVVTDLIEERVTEPSLLIGHSFGGVAMLNFALHNPDRVLGVALIEPVFIAAALADPHSGQSSAEDSAEYAYSQLARAGQFEDAAQSFYHFNDPSREWAALPEAAQRAMIRQMQLLPATEPGVAEDTAQLLAPGLMEGFAPPVLLIGGIQSPAIFPAIIRALAKRLPNVESAVIADAGHMAPMTHAPQTAACIVRWMQVHGLGATRQ